GVGADLATDDVADRAVQLLDRAGVADTHAAAVGGGEARLLGLLQDRPPRVLRGDGAGLEGEGAGRVGRVEVDARHLEVLHAQLVGGVEVGVGVAYRRDEAGGTADVGQRGGGV